MTSAMIFFVESSGIQLPDGTIFGAGITHEYDILKGENRPNAFTVYQYIGKQRVSITGNENWTYRQMRDWVHDQVRHYESCDMKLWVANHSDWSKATYKKQVTEEW